MKAVQGVVKVDGAWNILVERDGHCARAHASTPVLTGGSEGRIHVHILVREGPRERKENQHHEQLEGSKHVVSAAAKFT